MKNIKYILLLFILSVMLLSCEQKEVKNESSKLNESKEKNQVQKTINTPDEALNELISGNNRFLNGKLETPDHYKEQMKNTKDDQFPHSVILSCIDSRVPPEILFDQGIGNIFVARVAGNVEDANILGGLEFAAKIKKCKLIVVMGHSKCGAVQGAIDNAELGNLTQLVNQIKPAITGDKSDPNKMLDETSRNNVKLTIKNILKNSAVVSELVNEGKVKIVGAYYDLSNGKVEFLK